MTIYRRDPNPRRFHRSIRKIRYTSVPAEYTFHRHIESNYWLDTLLMEPYQRPSFMSVLYNSQINTGQYLVIDK